MTLPVDGIKLHRGNFAAIGQQIQPLLDAGQCFRLQVKPWREKRSLSQNALFHLWMGEISEYLIKSGRTDATPEWVKRNLKKTYLGCEEVTYIDFITGAKETSWEPRHTSLLDTGEMHIFMCKVEAWAMNIGCHLTIPQSCEYQQLRDKQEA
ncbi:YbcN family protein [Enterobacter hormaechei]|uniref:YbcN family protein n=1 Tax=Enterobacter hormaechei TaxID=158836 RepID=UPI0022F09E85|nr:YbcN family protein [Enterobacter hormaechei]MDA4839221.1 YbcN family protein [Enterobacter hormaechei]